METGRIKSRKEVKCLEVIVFSAKKSRADRIKHIADDILNDDNNLKFLSLHWITPHSLPELTDILDADKAYLIIFDILNYGLWETDICGVSEKYRSAAFCVVSDTHDNFIRSYNVLDNTRIYGFINLKKTDFEEELRNVFRKVSRNIFIISEGIIVAENSIITSIIPFSEIYYIETVKQTHYCTVYHRNGEDRIRADISKLIKQLDGRFRIIRASTIANLSAVRYMKNKELHFENGIFCTLKPNSVNRIKRLMQEPLI